MVTRQLQVERQTGSLVEDQRSTTVPRNQLKITSLEKS